MKPERNYLIHPSFIILFLLIAGISALFLGFACAYIYTRLQNNIPPVKLPTLFYFNSLILIASSGTLIWAKRCYQKDNTSGYKLALLSTLVLTILFLIAQIMAWKQLISSDIFIDYNNMASYMYAISGLHFAHVIAGIPFLTMFVINAFKKMKSPVSVLVYFSDLQKKRRLDLFNVYWHFLDILWILLVAFLGLNYLLS